jgi:hypothetical protein
MKLFRRYEQCYGLSLPAIGRWKIEVWFCMPNYKIKEHAHNNEDITLVFLFGKDVVFHKHSLIYNTPIIFLANFPRHFLKCFNIWAGESHYFEVSSTPLIFLSIERWKKGVKITSASEDLQLTSQQQEFDYAKTS